MRTLLLSLLLATPVLADVIIIPPNHDKPVTKLLFTVSTGDDALSRTSKVSAFVVLKNGRRIESKALNCDRKQQCAALPAKSKKKLEWTIGPDQSFTPERILRVGLTFKGAKPDPSQPADAWDLTAVSVDYVAAATTTGLVSMSYQGRNYRLKSGESWQWDVAGQRRGGGPPRPQPQ